MARPAASEQPGRPQSDAPAPPSAGRPGWLTPVNAAIVICTLLGLGLRVLLISRPAFLMGVTEYDDGPYFGSAVNLVHGLLPYRSFILVQPPGITLLMVPAALLTKVTGTATAMAVGRLLTVLASTAGILLAGLLIRHRGVLAVLVACGIFAVYPDSVVTSRTVLVEPWLALFCLLGALALFDTDRLTSSGKRLVWGGVAFGFAGAVEGWAIFPVVVLAVMLLPRPRRLGRFAGGVAAGFLVPVLPFAAAAPYRFYQSLYVAQVAPRAGSTRDPLGDRLINMLGIGNLPLPPHPLVLSEVAALVLVVMVAAVIAAAWRISRRPPPPLDWFAMVTCVVVVIMFLWPDQFHYHFSAFLVPFLGLSLALPAARLAEVAGAGPAGLAAPGGRRLWPPAAVAAGVAIAVLALDQGNWEARATVPGGPVSPAAGRIIMPGSCVATDQVSFLLMANRFFAHGPGCPPLLDGLGSDLAFSNGLKPGTGAGGIPAVAALWRSEFGHAQYAWLSFTAYRRIAWTTQLRAYFKANFVPVFTDGGRDTVYARKGLRKR
jgi:hypothetical protein